MRSKAVQEWDNVTGQPSSDIFFSPFVLSNISSVGTIFSRIQYAQLHLELLGLQLEISVARAVKGSSGSFQRLIKLPPEESRWWIWKIQMEKEKKNKKTWPRSYYMPTSKTKTYTFFFKTLLLLILDILFLLNIEFNYSIKFQLGRVLWALFMWGIGWQKTHFTANWWLEKSSKRRLERELENWVILLNGGAKLFSGKSRVIN